MKIIVTIIPTNLVTSLLNFQQVGGLVTRNRFDFCLQRVALYFKGTPNSMEFYKRISSHVTPVRIIISWLDGQLLMNFHSLNKSFVQMSLSSNLSLFRMENMLP